MLLKSLLQGIDEAERRKRERLEARLDAERTKGLAEIIFWKNEELSKITRQEWIEEYWYYKERLKEAIDSKYEDSVWTELDLYLEKIGSFNEDELAYMQTTQLEIIVKCMKSAVEQQKPLFQSVRDL